VTVITAEQINRAGQRTLIEALNSVQGLYATCDRNYHYLGVRGFSRPGDYGTRVLVLVDGHRVNENVYYSTGLGQDFVLDVDLIERVEIIRGPGSSLYGSNAFLAVINVVTKRGQALAGGEVSGAYGRHDSWHGRFSYGQQLRNGVEFLLSGSYLSSEGVESLYFPEFDTAANNRGVAQDKDGEGMWNMFGRLSYKDFTLQAAFTSREKEIPTGAYETVFNDPRNWTRDDRGYVDLSFHRKVVEATELRARVYYDYYRYMGNYAYDLAPTGAPPAIGVNIDRGFGQWWGAEAQVNQRLFDRHTLSLGGEIRHNLQQDQDNFYEGLPQPALHDRRDSVDGGVFCQGELCLLTNLTFNAGVRYDYYETFGGTANPRLGLIYNPTAASAVKLLYGQAFRAPNVYELYYEEPVSQKSNPEPKPETVQTYELVWEQDLGPHFRSSLSGYYYHAEDLIVLENDPTDGFDVFRNAEEVDAFGVEAALEAKLPFGLRGRVGYSLQEAYDQRKDERLSNSPEHLGKLNLSLPVFEEKLVAGLELLAASPRRTLAGAYTDPHALVNLTLLSRNLVRNLELSASVYNLFDTQYSDPAGPEHAPLVDMLARDGRSFRVKLTWRF
jgi:iron complex outermembrane receptor protein